MTKEKERPKWCKINIARKALQCWDFDKKTSLRHVQWGENATWMVMAGNSRYALRIYRPNRWTASQIEAEHELIKVIGPEFGALEPVLGKDNKMLQIIPDTPWMAAIFPWYEGKFIFDRISTANINRWGIYMGCMHTHLMENCEIKEPTRAWNYETLIHHPHRVMKKIWPDLDKGRSFPENISQIAEFMNREWRSADLAECFVHADLHVGNIKWSPTALHPFDFDDCGHAPLAYDIAIPACCFGGLVNRTDRLETFLSGYNSTAPQKISLETLRLFMAIRKIWTMGWCCERRDVFTDEYLLKRCSAYIKSLESWMSETADQKGNTGIANTGIADAKRAKVGRVKVGRANV